MADRFRIVSQTLAAELARPYIHGESDCFFLGCRVADALDMPHGALNLVERYGGAYSTLLGAQRALRKHGFATLAELFASHLPACAPAEARLGDIVILDLTIGGKRGQHVGVCLGARFVTRSERGRSDHGVGDCVAAFRTGVMTGAAA